MMMWEKLKVVAVGVLAAAGLAVQALSQQARTVGFSQCRRLRLRRNPLRNRTKRKWAIADGSGACRAEPSSRSSEFLPSPPAPIPGGVPTGRRYTGAL